MKIRYVAINAKYAHTNLAVRYLKLATAKVFDDVDFLEYTINHHTADILQDLILSKADALLFSCYIWNIDLCLHLAANVKKVRPETVIVLGGPEVSYSAAQTLNRHPFVDFVLCGEGEVSAPALLTAIDKGENPTGIPGVATRQNPDPTFPLPVDMDELPFPYPDLSRLSNRAVYYESSRGCPFGCSYCLSSADRHTRFRSLELVYADLQKFLDAGVLRIKFVDRTFNVNKERAMAIWQYAKEHDNGITCLHCEIGADLLTPEMTDFLNTLRPGLVQLEIGVQSTCAPTLLAVCRSTDLQALYRNVTAVRKGGNIHQHLDLIAGLPGEDFDRFAQSYNDVFALRPQQLQLGFLKLLKGSTLYADAPKYGLVFDDRAPYEVLKTNHISFEELCTLKTVEEMTESYYNTGRFSRQIEYLLTLTPSAFDLFLNLGSYYKSAVGSFKNAGKIEMYEVLYDYFKTLQAGDEQVFCALALFDFITHERPVKLPRHLANSDAADHRADYLRFLAREENMAAYLPAYAGLDPKQVLRQVHFQHLSLPEGEVVVLCDYQSRRFDGEYTHFVFDKQSFA